MNVWKFRFFGFLIVLLHVVQSMQRALARRQEIQKRNSR